MKKSIPPSLGTENRERKGKFMGRRKYEYICMREFRHIQNYFFYIIIKCECVDFPPIKIVMKQTISFHTKCRLNYLNSVIQVFDTYIFM